MKLILGSVLKIDNPSPELITWCRHNLIVLNPEYHKKLRMGLWLGNTPERLYLYERRGDSLILPYGTLREILPFLNDTEIINNFNPNPEKINFGKPIPLYDYQKTALETCVTNQYGILQAPAGSGKTQIGLALIQYFGRKSLWLCHTKDLIRQSKQRAELYMDKSLMGTITEGKVNIGRGITFATVQTMCKLDLARYRDIWDVVCVDEAHRVSGSPTTVTQYQKVLNGLAARHKYGLSATVHRSDGLIKATYALLGGVVHNIPKETVADNIMQVGIRSIDTGIKISLDCLNTDGTLNYQKLISYISSHSSRNKLIADWIITENKSSLILSDRLEQLDLIMEMLPEEHRKIAIKIDGSMTSKREKTKREKALQDMRDGEKKYLFASYALAKEGLDIPRLERLFMASPVKDYAVVTQAIGRLSRVFEGKSKPIAFDFIDDIGFLIKAYKTRCTTYRKNNCYFV